MNDNCTFEILEHIGVIAEKDNGWKREINIVSWNGGQPKYDIREWDVDHSRMSRGITMVEEQAKALYSLLKERYEK